ncbi:MAG: metallophosphatase family protein [Thermomicrobia bacterium]|nr:metallophosphatase family protein [Thermomicrobia bacterium]
MRIALFSDGHGNLTALRAVLAALDRHRPLQMIVAAGDHVLVGPRPAETWDTLQAAGCACILGNEDVRLWEETLAPTQPDSPWTPLVAAITPWTAAALGPARLAAMRALPRSLRVTPGSDAGLLVVHANRHDLTGWALKADTPDDDLARLYGGVQARVVCCGHYHAPCVREWRDMMLVNVASVSLPTDGQPRAAYTILNWDGEWQIAQYCASYDMETEAAAMALSTIPKSVPSWSPPVQ